MSKKKTIITIVIMIILVAIVAGGYYYVSKKRSQEREEKETVQTEVDKILEKNLDASYPVTAREVVKYYSRIMKCLYNEEMTEEEIGEMLHQLRKLFDAEFLANNSYENQLSELTEELAEAEACMRIINSYQIEKADTVITWENEGYDYARMIACYTQKEGTQYLRVYEEFVLRKDETNRWRILGWRLTDAEEMERK